MQKMAIFVLGLLLLLSTTALAREIDFAPDDLYAQAATGPVESNGAVVEEEEEEVHIPQEVPELTAAGEAAVEGSDIGWELRAL